MSTTPYEGSPLGYDYAVHPNQGVTLRDGTRLATDVYVPALGDRALSGAFPVVLERTPDDKSRNTGEPLGLERRFTVAHQSVFHDAARPSHIVLPIIPADP